MYYMSVFIRVAGILVEPGSLAEKPGSVFWIESGIWVKYPYETYVLINFYQRCGSGFGLIRVFLGGRIRILVTFTRISHPALIYSDNRPIIRIRFFLYDLIRVFSMVGSGSG